MTLINPIRRRRGPVGEQAGTDGPAGTVEETRSESRPAPIAPVRRRRLEGFTAGTAYATRSTMLWLARLVRLVAVGVALVIGIAILLRVLDANPANSIVSDFHDAGRTLAWVFKGMFTIKHHPEATFALNWGIAAIVYLIVGNVIAQMIASGRPRRRAARRTTAVA
jgi:hypothetical protein